MPVFPGPSSPWASAGTERPDQLPPNTCRYTGRANGLTTREPDERAGNCCQKRWKDLRKGRRCRDATAAKLSVASVNQLLALKWSAFNGRNKTWRFSFEWLYSQQKHVWADAGRFTSALFSAQPQSCYLHGTASWAVWAVRPAGRDGNAANGEDPLRGTGIPTSWINTRVDSFCLIFEDGPSRGLLISKPKNTP